MTVKYPEIQAGLKVRHRETLEERTVTAVLTKYGRWADMSHGGNIQLDRFWAIYEPLPQPGDRVRVVRSAENHSACINSEGTLRHLRDKNFFISEPPRTEHYGPLSDFEVILPEVFSKFLYGAVTEDTEKLRVTHDDSLSVNEVTATETGESKVRIANHYAARFAKPEESETNMEENKPETEPETELETLKRQVAEYRKYRLYWQEKATEANSRWAAGKFDLAAAIRRAETAEARLARVREAWSDSSLGMAAFAAVLMLGVSES